MPAVVPTGGGYAGDDSTLSVNGRDAEMPLEVAVIVTLNVPVVVGVPWTIVRGLDEHRVRADLDPIGGPALPMSHKFTLSDTRNFLARSLESFSTAYQLLVTNRVRNAEGGTPMIHSGIRVDTWVKLEDKSDIEYELLNNNAVELSFGGQRGNFQIQATKHALEELLTKATEALLELRAGDAV